MGLLGRRAARGSKRMFTFPAYLLPLSPWREAERNAPCRRCPAGQACGVTAKLPPVPWATPQAGTKLLGGNANHHAPPLRREWLGRGAPATLSERCKSKSKSSNRVIEIPSAMVIAIRIPTGKSAFQSGPRNPKRDGHSSLHSNRALGIPIG